MVPWNKASRFSDSRYFNASAGSKWRGLQKIIIWRSVYRLSPLNIISWCQRMSYSEIIIRFWPHFGLRAPRISHRQYLNLWNMPWLSLYRGVRGVNITKPELSRYAARPCETRHAKREMKILISYLEAASRLLALVQIRHVVFMQKRNIRLSISGHKWS